MYKGVSKGFPDCSGHKIFLYKEMSTGTWPVACSRICLDRKQGCRI